MQPPSKLPPMDDDDSNVGILHTALQGIEARKKLSATPPPPNHKKPPLVARATTTPLPNTTTAPPNLYDPTIIFEEGDTPRNNNNASADSNEVENQNTVRRTHRRGLTGISLRDVLAHNPTEDACETYIQQALEQVAAEAATAVTSGSNGDQHPLGILSQVPDETRSHEFVQEEPSTIATGSKAASSLKSNFKKPNASTTATTTAQTLTGLVAELQSLHGGRTPDAPMLGAKPSSKSEAMAQAAVAMVEETTVTKEEQKTSSANNIQTEALRDSLYSKTNLQTESNTSLVGLTIGELNGLELEPPPSQQLEKVGSEAFETSSLPPPPPPETENDVRSTSSSVGILAMENGAGAGGDGAKNINSMHSSERKSRQRHRVTSAKAAAAKEFNAVSDYFHVAQGSMLRTARNVLIVVLVLTGLAAVLYYAADNPPCHGDRCSTPPPTAAPTEEVEEATNTVQINTTTAEDGTTSSSVNIKVPTEETAATATSSSLFIGASSVFSNIPNALRYTAFSWWLLFVVRQIMTLMLARITQGIVVDICSVRTKVSLRLLGPFVTLFLVQAKGFPFITCFWGLYNFLLLWGGTTFARHWLFWQDLAWLEMNTEANSVQEVTTNIYYTRILIIMIMLGVMMAMKRFWFSLFLGRQTFRRYADELAKVIQNALYVGQVATLAKDLERLSGRATGDEQREKIRAIMEEIEERNQQAATADGGTEESSILGEVSKVSATDNIFKGADIVELQREKLEEILGAFEEPERVNASHQKVKISDIIQFRQSLSYLYTEYPFTLSFGPCDTREACIRSSEDVYHRLARHSTSQTLHFETIALLGIRSDGSLNEEKLTDLVRLFRPQRDGRLPLLDFAKSVDGVYKNLRTLRASVANSSRIDAAFEGAINIILYFGVSFIIVAIMGVNPLVLFTSLAGVALSFNFMFSASCGKIFDGALLIFARKPYEIGDRIAISSPETDTSPTGSPGWIVQDVNLLTTTVVYGSTSEVATISNGSIASSRIINCARSPKAFLHFTIMFPLETPYQQLKIFKTCIEKFIRDRPRQWASFSGFRASRVDIEHASVEYFIAATHRESWQQVQALLESKADLSSFALELQKKMGLKYMTPPTPVDLRLTNAAAKDGLDTIFRQRGSFDSQQIHSTTSQQPAVEPVNYDSVSAMFERHTSA